MGGEGSGRPGKIKREVNTTNQRKRYLGISDLYKHVYKHQRKKSLVFRAELSINGKMRRKEHDDEREAAKWVDMQLISAGKEPVNILKRKTKE